MNNPRFERMFNIAVLNLEERVRVITEKWSGNNGNLQSEALGQLQQDSGAVPSTSLDTGQAEPTSPIIGGDDNQSPEV